MDNEFVCCICGKKFTGFGNNPFPVNKEAEARCCDDCNYTVVVPARLEVIIGGKYGRK